MPITPEDAPLKPKADLDAAPARSLAPQVPDSLSRDHLAPETIGDQKDIAFYSAAVNGWITTRMEYDKTLLTLSAGGLGLFSTLLTTVGVRSLIEVGFYVVGTIGFISAIYFGLAIFKRNGKFLEELLGRASNTRHDEGDPILDRLDKRLRWSFAVGAVAAILAGASAAGVKYYENQNQITSGERLPDDKKPKDTKPIVQPPASPQKSSAESLHESVNGFQKLRPGAGRIDTGSINGLQNLKPRPTVAPTAPSVKPSELTTVKPTTKKDL